MKRILSFFAFILIFNSVVFSQLSGTYVINQDGGADFNSLTQAANALNTQGMSGNVTLKLSTGLYAEQVLFNIPNQTENQILTIESQSGNESDVVFRFEEAHDDTNYQIAFNGIKALSIRNISINTATLSNGVGIFFTGECHNITIDNIHHDGNRNDAGILGSQTLDFITPALPLHNVVITNSFFHECSPSIGWGPEYYFNPDGLMSSNVQITGNTFFDANGIYLKFTKDFIIENNLFYGEEYKVKALNLSYSENFKFQKNKIWYSFNTIEISSCTGTSENPLNISNNFISGTENIVTLNSNAHLLFANNSVFGDSDNELADLYVNTNTQIFNNIFYQNHPAGHIFNLAYTEDGSVYDYNCLYSNGAYAIDWGETSYLDLNYSEYKNQTNREANGINAQPNFTIPGEDLHTLNSALNAGQPLPLVLTDIDGELRSTINPTIGADEIDGVVVSVDLTIDTVITAANAVAGEQLSIVWTGSNDSPGIFNAPWIDRIYLSDDAVLDNSDIQLDNYNVQENLPAFGTYSRQQLVTLNLNLAGIKYIIVKIDAEANLIEDNSNNVAVSAPFTITQPNLPNLVVTAIELPDNVFSGTQLQINYTVTNMGTAPASGNWKDYIWFEDHMSGFSQGSYHLINTPIAIKHNPVGLMPGESYTGIAIGETPYIGQGYKYIRVETDRFNNIIEEQGEDDNFTFALTDSVFVNQSPLADLVIEDIQIPAETFAGEEITISYTVKNIGTQTTSPVQLPYTYYFGYNWSVAYSDWVDYTYFSDTLFDFLPSQYKRVNQHDGNIGVDSSYTVIQTIQIPECISGPYFFTIYADRWNHVAELAEDNNAAISDTIHIIPRPAGDLIATSNDPLNGLSSNEIYTVSYTIINQGSDTVSSSWRDRAFISDSATFQYNINEIVSDAYRDLTLAPDAESAQTLEVQIAPSVYGEKFLYIWIDALNDYCEYPYDKNNILKLPISIAQSPAADLQIDWNLPSGNMVAGDEPNLQGVVTNIGSTIPNNSNWRDIIFLVSDVNNEDTVYKETYQHSNGLAPNGSYNLPNPFLIPLDIDPGFYSLGIQTDARNTVWENEMDANNIVKTNPFQITIDSSRTPDLQAVQIESLNWESGQTYMVEIKAKNNGISTGISSWVDELFITNASGQRLASGTAIFSGNLATNSTYSTNIEIHAPLGLPESAYLNLRIDTSNAVFEYNTVNNFLQIPIVVNQGPSPDLSPTDFQVAAQINAGQELNVTLLRNNFGDAGIVNKNWNERIILSQNNTPDNNDIILRSYAYSNESFDAQSSEMFEDHIQIPLTLTGNYYVIYLMDSNNYISEGNNEDNNYIVSEVPLQIITPLPVDFNTELIEFSVSEGNLDNLNYTLTNSGTNQFKGIFYNMYYLSSDPDYSSDDILFGRELVYEGEIYVGDITLNPGESVENSVYFSYVPVAAGDYYVIQKIDAFLHVYETNELNNTKVFGPIFLDNTQEIFPDITYEKQFGRNMPHHLYDIVGEGWFNPFVFDDFGPDRHDYKIHIPDGFGMITEMWENETANEAYGINNESQPIYEMYIGEEFVPTPLEFDFRFDSPMQSSQTIIVPVSIDRTDYIKTQAPYIPPHFNPDSVPLSRYFLRAEFKEFSVYKLHPEKIGTAHNVTMRITGFDLTDTLGFDVALFQGNDTVYSFETYPQNSSELIAYIDMRKSDPGEYKLLVRKRTTGDYTIWEETVKVVDDEGPVYYSKLTSPSETRLPNSFTINVEYGNKGYSNEYDMALYVAFFFEDTIGGEISTTSEGFSVEFLGASIPGLATTGFISNDLNPAEYVDYGDMGYARVYAIRIPIMHAQFGEGLSFKITPTAQGEFYTQTSLELIRRSPYSFTGRIEDAGTSYYPVMIGRAIAETEGVLELSGSLKANDCSQTLNADQMTLRIAQETKKVADIAQGSTSFVSDVKKAWSGLVGPGNTPEKRYDSYKKIIKKGKGLSLTADDDTPFASELTDVFKCIDYDTNSEAGCWETRTWTKDNVKFSVEVYNCDPGGKLIPPDRPKPSKPGPLDRARTRIRRALDPNEIVGPNGEGFNRIVANDEEFMYTIYFENVAEATAPAARVRIDNPLDTNLRIQSFRMVSFGFADTTFQFNNPPFVQQTFDLGDGFGDQKIRIMAGTNPDSQKAFFEFTTINPETQGIVSGANDGFLLPNDSTGRGQGFVTYIINAKRDLDPGTVIKNKAAIIFDENEIIETNTWSNTIAGGELHSRVNDLPEYSSTQFSLSWINETPAYAPVVKSFDIYVRNVTANGDWERWIADTKSMGKKFTGIPGNKYEFISQAKSDQSKEVFAVQPDAVTTILNFGGSVDDGNPLLFPNPASDATTLAYRSPGADVALRLNITDIQGKEIQSFTFTTPGDGIQFLPISIRQLSAGVYVVSLFEGNNKKGYAKLVVTGTKKN